MGAKIANYKYFELVAKVNDKEGLSFTVEPKIPQADIFIYKSDDKPTNVSDISDALKQQSGGEDYTDLPVVFDLGRDVFYEAKFGKIGSFKLQIDKNLYYDSEQTLYYNHPALTKPKFGEKSPEKLKIIYPQWEKNVNIEKNEKNISIKPANQSEEVNIEQQGNALVFKNPFSKDMIVITKLKKQEVEDLCKEKPGLDSALTMLEADPVSESYYIDPAGAGNETMITVTNNSLLIDPVGYNNEILITKSGTSVLIDPWGPNNETLITLNENDYNIKNPGIKGDIDIKFTGNQLSVKPYGLGNETVIIKNEGITEIISKKDGNTVKITNLGEGGYLIKPKDVIKQSSITPKNNKTEIYWPHQGQKIEIVRE